MCDILGGCIARGEVIGVVRPKVRRLGERGGGEKDRGFGGELFI